MDPNKYLSTEKLSYLYARDPSIKEFNWPAYNATNFQEQLKAVEEENKKQESQTVDTINIYLRIKGGTTNSRNKYDDLYTIEDRQVICKVPKTCYSARNTREDENVFKRYEFTDIFGPNSTQEDVFESVVKPKILKFINGYNGNIMTYGASGSGKSFTIVGTPKEPGLLPRSLEYLFNSLSGLADTTNIRPNPDGTFTHISDNQMKENFMHWQQYILKNSLVDRHHDERIFRTMQQQLRRQSVAIIDEACIDTVNTSIWVSYAEIYNEQIYDLLVPTPNNWRNRPKLKLGNNHGFHYIKDLTLIKVNTAVQAFQVLQYGMANLKNAATNINVNSSRSHSIFTVKLVQVLRSEDAENNSKSSNDVLISNLNFCDLAGSERSKKTHNTGDRLKESNNINTSLLVLGRCIQMVRDNFLLSSTGNSSGNSKKGNEMMRLVPFRESKLTQLFQRALSGLETIMMIVNINPTLEMFDETQHVLNFSAIAKEIIVEDVKNAVKSISSKTDDSGSLSLTNSTTSSYNNSNKVENNVHDLLYYKNLCESLREENLRLILELEEEQKRSMDLLTEKETQMMELEKEIVARVNATWERYIVQNRQEMNERHNKQINELKKQIAEWQSKYEKLEAEYIQKDEYDSSSIIELDSTIESFSDHVSSPVHKNSPVHESSPDHESSSVQGESLNNKEEI